MPAQPLRVPATLNPILPTPLLEPFVFPVPWPRNDFHALSRHTVRHARGKEETAKTNEIKR